MAGIQYVCGFAFNDMQTKLALIIKNRGPANMSGHLNGIGGKIERGESARGAMAREFQEETGMETRPEQWMCYHTERWLSSGDVCYFMVTTVRDFHLLRTMTDEAVVTAYAEHSAGESWDDFGVSPPMYNLRYLIPMAQSWLQRPGDRYFES